MTVSAWTQDRIDRLKVLWAEGRTADQIARELQNGLSRSAVLGKVHRLGLSAGRAATPPKPGRTPSRRSDAGPPASVSQATSAPTGIAAPERPGVDLLRVGRTQCRWPVGDPLAPGFGLCGRPVARGAYCADHAGHAYRASKDTPASLERLARMT